MQDARDEFHKELFDEATLPEDIAKIKEGWLAQADKPELDHAELNSLLAHAYHQINALKGLWRFLFVEWKIGKLIKLE